MKIPGFFSFLANFQAISQFFPGHSVSRLISGFPGRWMIFSKKAVVEPKRIAENTFYECPTKYWDQFIQPDVWIMKSQRENRPQ